MFAVVAAYLHNCILPLAVAEQQKIILTWVSVFRGHNAIAIKEKGSSFEIIKMTLILVVKHINHKTQNSSRWL